MPNVPKNIITLAGPNTYLLEQKLAKLKADFTAKHTELAVEIIDGEEVELDQIKQALESPSFLSPQKMVVVKRLGNNKKSAEKVEELLSLSDEETTLIFVEPKPDKRSVFYKTLKGQTNFEEFKELDESTLIKWLVQEAKNSGGDISSSDARYLIDRVGLSQQMLYNELSKLLDYHSKITREDIEELTEASMTGTIFNLLDAAFAGNKKRTIELYESQRAQKVEPPIILSMLVWQLHIVAIVKAGGEKSPDVIAKEAGLSPFVVSKSKRIADKLTRTELRELLHRLSTLDAQIKTEVIDIDDALKNFLLELA